MFFFSSPISKLKWPKPEEKMPIGGRWVLAKPQCALVKKNPEWVVVRPYLERIVYNNDLEVNGLQCIVFIFLTTVPRDIINF